MSTDSAERELMENLTAHINSIKPRQFAVCMVHDPCISGRYEGDVIGWGLVMRRGVTLLDDDGTPVGLYRSVEDAAAWVAREYRATNTRILWLTPELTDPPAEIPVPRHLAAAAGSTFA